VIEEQEGCEEEVWGIPPPTIVVRTVVVRIVRIVVVSETVVLVVVHSLVRPSYFEPLQSAVLCVVVV